MLDRAEVCPFLLRVFIREHNHYNAAVRHCPQPHPCLCCFSCVSEAMPPPPPSIISCLSHDFLALRAREQVFDRMDERELDLNEVQIYTWHDATLRELSDLVKVGWLVGWWVGWLWLVGW